MQSWNLHEIETPGGSISPVVLDSDDAARVVLIGLDPGQELGDASEVVPVSVGDQDRDAADADPGELQPELRRVPTRVDNDRFAGRLRGTYDVAVRPDRAELVAIDDQGHRTLTGG